MMFEEKVEGKSKLITAAAKSLQSCPTLCDPVDGSSPGSLVPGILQASIGNVKTYPWFACGKMF